MRHEARLDLLQRLIDLTEQQLEAARTFDTAALLSCTERRAELVFSLRMSMEEPLPPEGPERTALTERAQRLSSLERRLTRIAAHVLEILERIAPPTRPPATYRATGRLTG